jgi:hypothetical protein
MKMRTIIMLAAMAGNWPVASVMAADTALKDALVRLERERQDAYVKGDRIVLERQFAAEYSHTNLRGAVTDRAAELAFYAPGSMELKNGSITDVTVHDYGDVAVLLGTVNWEGATYHPAPGVNVDLSGQFRVTRVYVDRDGRWQLATSHASQIPPPAAPAAVAPASASGNEGGAAR